VRIIARRAACADRIRSMARRRAAVTSQASTDAGTPRSGQVCSASRKASAVASSAMSRSRTDRRVIASTRPANSRCALAAASATPGGTISR